MFPGSSDRKTPVEGFLREPISAQYVRINPQAWHNNIALRLDIFGCDVGSKDGMFLILHRRIEFKHQTHFLNPFWFCVLVFFRVRSLSLNGIGINIQGIAVSIPDC